MKTIVEAIEDPNLFAPLFADPATWAAWRVVLKAMFALPMDEPDRRLYRTLTGRSTPPVRPAKEAWLVKGRRGGGSFVAALVAVYMATFRDWTPYLGPGERATVMVIAADRRQARVIFRYVMGILDAVPMLRARVECDAAEAVELRGRVTVEVHTASFRSVRGYTIPVAVLDEVAFWRSEESTNPDIEILNALRPAMATLPDPLLLVVSSPYARRGALWEAFRDHHGEDGDMLVVKADTRTLNPTVPERVIDAAYTRDPAAAAAEYGAEFRSDVSTLFDEALLAGLTDRVRERPPVEGAAYHAFADPSGGRGDAFTLAVAHRENDGAMLDLVVGDRPPFDPVAVVKKHARLIKDYGLSAVTGDRYAGAWVSDAYGAEGVAYTAVKLTKSEIYLETLPLFTRGSARLVDHPVLLTELARLERRTARSGRDTVDHPPRGHDDYANAAAGALWLAAGSVPLSLDDFVAGDPSEVVADPASPWGPTEPFSVHHHEGGLP